MHYLDRLIADVETTHDGMGRLVAISVLFARSRRTLLVIAPSGTGKSRAQEVIKACLGNTIEISATTGVGLSNFQEQLSGSYGVVLVDDLGGIRTFYARLETLVTFSELVYSHKAGHSSGKVFFEITNFNGSAILAVQPVVLKPLLREAQWEANINDKVTRYYHFNRPRTENIQAPVVEQAPDIQLQHVEDMSDEMVRSVATLLRQQHGSARALEHAHYLVRGAAALDGRRVVNGDDIDVVCRLIRPITVEVFLLRRAGFEEKRELDTPMIYLLAEWITHGEFTLKQLQQDYKLSQSTAYTLMEKYRKLWTLRSKSPTVYVPSDVPIFAGEATTMAQILRLAKGEG